MSFRLLVEGTDDKHLIKNVLREHGVALHEEKNIHVCGGVDSLLGDSLSTHLLSSYDAIGVIVDADENLEARWQAIRDRLTLANYEVPLRPPPEGLIVRNRQPGVGVWIMPDNSIPGLLEDFAQKLIDPGDILWPLAVDSVASIPAQERRFPPFATRKAEIHTFLAWQSEPGSPLGLAVTKKYFQADAAIAQKFAAWFRQLSQI